MRHVMATLGILAATTLFCSSTYAQSVPSSKRYIDAQVIEMARDVLANDIVALVVNAQNMRHAGISQADIDAIDQQWRAEREHEAKPLITATLTSPLSTYLLRVQAGSLGLLTEVFITDRFGLNVGQSSITSDYWQGDEAKFNKTFPNGPDAVFIDDAEWHDGSRTWRAQLNLTVSDPETGSAIGAATFEINLTELARQRDRSIALAPAQ